MAREWEERGHSPFLSCFLAFPCTPAPQTSLHTCVLPHRLKLQKLPWPPPFLPHSLSHKHGLPRLPCLCGIGPYTFGWENGQEGTSWRTRGLPLPHTRRGLSLLIRGFPPVWRLQGSQIKNQKRKKGFGEARLVCISLAHPQGENLVPGGELEGSWGRSSSPWWLRVSSSWTIHRLRGN